MAHRIYLNTYAPRVIPQNIPNKEVKKNGHTYVLVSTKQEKCSKFIAYLKAAGLLYATIYTAGLACISKNFRSLLVDNFRATFSGKRPVERFNLKNSGSKTTDKLITQN